MTLASALAGVGEYVAAAIGNCQQGPITSDAGCASEVTGLIRRFDDVAEAGKDVSDSCEAARKDYDLMLHPKSLASRLYEEGEDSIGHTVPVAPSNSASPILAMLLPLTAVAGFFVGSRWRQRLQEDEWEESFVEAPTEANEIVK